MGAEEQKSLARLAYEDAGREIGQSYLNMTSNMTFAIGLLTTVLAVIGAGAVLGGRSLSGPPTNGSGLPGLSPVSLVILCVLFPLLTRFMIRGILAHQNLLRYGDIRRSS